MKRLLTLTLVLSVFNLLSAQTFYLKFEEVTRNATVFEVDVFMAASSSTFRLGSSNLKFNFLPATIENPSLVSDSLTAANYDPVTVTEPRSGQASVNISLATLNNGDVLAQRGTAWTNIARVRFDVVDGSGDFSLNWLYNGGSTQTVVFNDNESTQIFVADPNEDLLNFNGTNLPVELTYFEAAWKNHELQRNVELDWITETEQNSDFFRVQRSFDGRDWDNIGRLASAGTTIERQFYDFEDNGIGSQMPGTYVYYRLKQVDLDGSVGYSDVRVLERTSGNQQNFLTAHPNPVEDVLQIEAALRGEGPLRLRLVGLNGQIYKEQVWDNGFTENLQLDVSDLPAGIYFLHLQNQEQGLERKIVKQ